MKLLKHLDFTPIGKAPNVDASSIAMTPLLKELIHQEEGHVSQVVERGYIKKDPSDPHNLRFFNKLKELGGRLLHKSIGDDSYEVLFLWEHGAANVSCGKNAYLTVEIVSRDETWTTQLQKFVRDQLAPAVPRGHIFAIVRHGQSLTLSPIGNAAVPLEAGNYTPEVMESYKFVLRDLASSAPSGRIIILEGEPGTGKTHLIRALLNDVSNVMFVLVSPDMVPSLSGPDLLPILINTKNSYNISGAIVLVLEDADRCLVRREGDNMSFIQGLLNLGDGILGSMLDLRIIATTNARKLDMESAILRPGRLSRRMEVGPLDLETARGVFKRLLPNTDFPKVVLEQAAVGLRSASSSIASKMTLAEVYSLARQHGWEPQSRETTARSSDAQEDDVNYEDDDDDDDE